MVFSLDYLLQQELTHATNTYDESAQLTNNVSLYPIGLQLTSATKRSVIVNYISCSRDAKEGICLILLILLILKFSFSLYLHIQKIDLFF